MLSSPRPAILISLIFLVLLGLAYLLAETGIGQAFFSRQANGSLTAKASVLVGQARNLPVFVVRWLIEAHIEQLQFGFLGSANINVLQLNESLAGMR